MVFGYRGEDASVRRAWLCCATCLLLTSGSFISQPAPFNPIHIYRPTHRPVPKLHRPRECYDWKVNGHDFCSFEGFLQAVVLVLRMKPGALLHIGLPCNGFIFMSSSVHKRSKEAPLGDMSRPSVVRSNCIFHRTVLLMYLALARRVYFFLEQPRSSVIPYMAAMQELLSLCGRGYHCTWWMGSFGHWCIKPSLGLGNTPWMPKLQLIGNRWSGT